MPPGPLDLPANATFVSDPDEEIFLLYTRLATLKPPDSSDLGNFHGLGSENSMEDALLVRIELKPPPTTHEVANMSGESKRNTGRKIKGKKKKSSRSDITIGHEGMLEWGGKGQPEPVVLEYELFQDKTALRSRSGDTGSVLWKASIEFLSLVLHQLHFPEPTRTGLFDYAKLSQTHILELGAGTGLLALGLSSLVRRYTATDVPALVPLLRKNLLSVTPTTANTVTVAALDWTLPARRQVDVCADPPDVLLVVDCIYHPTLVPPLLGTMTALAEPRRTVALVVAELRAEDVLRGFLEEWIALGWRVWSVGEGLLGPRWGMWVGWRETWVAE
ncbi:putative methyltransferase-domain-containing protein [Russula earlei]|uniref:Methyltransferase-domain-containing protein n=1 Tax=Russula earlei TaxID=71964 RepID=A0ACC0U396_9AGAM|nr:putative methyltransferase-domain-containing protein [Russula earlei]